MSVGFVVVGVTVVIGYQSCQITWFRTSICGAWFPGDQTRPVGSFCVFHENHCDAQLWEGAAHLLYYL